MIENRSDHRYEAMPCVFVLMTKGKTKCQDYAAALQILVDQARDRWQIDLTDKHGVRMAMCDFEIAERQAILQVLLIKLIRSCGFHYCQALLRNIGAHHLKAQYFDYEDTTFRDYVRQFMMLMLLPLHLVVRAVNLLLLQYREKTPADCHAKMRGWLREYFIKTWVITGVRGRKMRRWNHHRAVNRTNNMAERWNRHAHERMGKHPAWAKFATEMARIFALQLARATQLRKSGQLRKPLPGSKMVNDSLEGAWNLLDVHESKENGVEDSDILSFLKAASDAMCKDFDSFAKHVTRWTDAVVVGDGNGNDAADAEAEAAERDYYEI